MPLPYATRASDIPADVCCDTLWLMGERIREVAFDAVCSCLDTTCKDQPLKSWQSEGPRSLSAEVNSLVVTFVRSTLSPDSRTRRGGMRPIPITRAEYRVELREGPWPIVREHSATQTAQLPDPEVVHRLAKHARGHAEKMWRALLDGATRTMHTADHPQLFPRSTNPHIINRGVNVGDLAATGPSGPLNSYVVTVTIDHVLP